MAVISICKLLCNSCVLYSKESGVELEVHVSSTLTLIKHFCNVYNFIA